MNTRSIITAVLTLVTFALGAQAASLTWDNTAGGAINDGAGAWLGTGLWNNGSPGANWVSGSDAVFGNAGTGGAVALASPTVRRRRGFPHEMSWLRAASPGYRQFCRLPDAA